MKITVKTKFPNYGRNLFYPVCDKAKALCQMKGKKCLSRADIELLKALGFEVEVQTPEV